MSSSLICLECGQDGGKELSKYGLCPVCELKHEPFPPHEIRGNPETGRLEIRRAERLL